jgi:hypothetical protein
VAAEPEPEVPQTLHLGQNYPNPFNPSTTIPFALDGPAHVSVAVFDLAGRRVATLVDGHRAAGAYTAAWNAAGQASGVYLYRVSAGGKTVTRRMMLLK